MGVRKMPLRDISVYWFCEVGCPSVDGSLLFEDFEAVQGHNVMDAQSCRYPDVTVDYFRQQKHSCRGKQR